MEEPVTGGRIDGRGWLRQTKEKLATTHGSPTIEVERELIQIVVHVLMTDSLQGSCNRDSRQACILRGCGMVSQADTHLERLTPPTNRLMYEKRLHAPQGLVTMHSYFSCPCRKQQ